MSQTLLLNSSYEPLKVLPWERAMVLLWLGKAEMVEAYEGQSIGGVGRTYPMPSIIRLKRYARPERTVRFNRTNVYRRDAYTCQYCGEAPGAKNLTLDHVIPRSRGGRTDWTNITSSCRDCNFRKANRTPTEAKMHLRTHPTRPHSMALVAPNERPHKSWDDYLGA